MSIRFTVPSVTFLMRHVADNDARLGFCATLSGARGEYDG